MRNLRYLTRRTWHHEAITSTCWDPAKEELLCTLGPSESKATVELLRLSHKSPFTSHSVTSWDAPSPNPDVACDSVISAHHFGDTATTCVILAGGDIVTVQEPDGFSGQDDAHIEIVGSIDVGITAARWSPDEELLVITTKEGNAVFMGRSFDPVADVAMTAEDLKASKHVSVGWGKKETQFEGRGAKALRDPTIPLKVDEGVLSPCDDGSTTISWRGDGAYVAINSLEGPRRIVRVYTREGTLDSVSEPVDGLESALSWRPAGNLIAGIQRFEERIDVAFFERNGLRHGQFTLRIPGSAAKEQKRIGLEWNSDSTVLAVVLDDRVQLWTMGNYHWYLKQEMPTTAAFNSVAWHPEKPLRLAISTGESNTSAEFIFTIARGSLVPPNDHGAVAVIDGQNVKLTAFRTANIPPPMAMFELEASKSVIDVAFDGDTSLLAVLHHAGLDVYRLLAQGARLKGCEAVAKLTFEGQRTPLQVCYAGNEEFCVMFQHQNVKGRLQVYKLAQNALPHSRTFDLPEGGTTSSILNSPDAPGAEACLQDSQGKWFLVGSQSLMPSATQIATTVPWFQLVCTMAGTLGVAIGMSRNGHLYAGSRLLAKNCTSFLVTDAHIVFTTNNHFVKFVHLGEPEEMTVPADDPEEDERCRSIERGARLVTAMPTNMSLVLQMPRGNLETIYPRAMVVAGIRQLVDEKNYGRAFSYCRTQRVDMNILYDHNPEQFLSNVGLFLDQVQDITYVDLFLSSLREEDVTQTMYRNTKTAPALSTVNGAAETPGADMTTRAATTHVSKVNKACDAILKALQGRKGTHIQNVITAHVCKVPPALDDGLTLVAQLMDQDDKLAEKAVEHICFLVDVNRIYDHALGLYNLELALLVAQQSQRDPREYLPFIQSLHQLPDLRRRYEIDDHLERRTKALGHLKSLDAFDELQRYTTKHSLHQEALGLYRYDEARHRVLMNLYAEHLESRSKFRDAGLAHESLGNYVKATSCYRAAGASSWRECLFAAQQHQPALSPDAFADLANVLAEALTEAKDHAAAATIHIEYLKSTENAVRSLCKGSHFSEGLRLLALNDRSDLLTTVFDPALVDSLSTTTELLADCKAQLRAQVPRILELRRRAEEDPLAFYEGERSGGAADLPDDISVAASSRLSTGGASMFTRYTGKDGSVGTAGTGVSRATSKNRRREEKKRARGRKGTVYEEEYLINSVRRLVERIESVKAEVSALVFALVRRNMGERARAIEGLMGEVLEGCRTAVAEVFVERGPQGEQGPSGNTVEGDGGVVVRGGAGGGAGVFGEFLVARTQRQEPPVLSVFEKLILLGS